MRYTRSADPLHTHPFSLSCTELDTTELASPLPSPMSRAPVAGGAAMAAAAAGAAVCFDWLQIFLTVSVAPKLSAAACASADAADLLQQEFAFGAATSACAAAAATWNTLVCTASLWVLERFSVCISGQLLCSCVP